MKRLLLLASLLSVLGGNAAKADFGPADVSSSDNNESTVFDAWCGKRGNGCKIAFREGFLQVDDKHTVNYSQIRGFNYSLSPPSSSCMFWLGREMGCKDTHEFDIFYFRNNGEPSVAKVIFVVEKPAKSFYASLDNVTGNQPRRKGDPRCFGRDIVFQGVCVSPEKALDIWQSERNSIRESEAEMAPDVLIQQNQQIQQNNLFQ